MCKLKKKLAENKRVETIKYEEMNKSGFETRSHFISILLYFADWKEEVSTNFS